MLALAGKARELPDQNDLEGRLGTAPGIQHLRNSGVGDAPALRFVHVLASHDVAVLGT